MLAQYFSKAQSPAVSVSPPPARNEHPESRPGFLWIQGYWDWRDERHVWVAGRWEQARTGYHWLPHRWVLSDGHWYLKHGGWAPDPQVASVPGPRKIVWLG